MERQQKKLCFKLTASRQEPRAKKVKAKQKRRHFTKATPTVKPRYRPSSSAASVDLHRDPRAAASPVQPKKKFCLRNFIDTPDAGSSYAAPAGEQRIPESRETQDSNFAEDGFFENTRELDSCDSSDSSDSCGTWIQRCIYTDDEMEPDCHYSSPCNLPDDPPKDLQAIVKCRKIPGESDTFVVIITSASDKLQEFATFLIRLSLDVTSSQTSVLTGPMEHYCLSLCLCLQRPKMFIFQYAKCHNVCKPVSSWTAQDQPCDPYRLAMQILLTLKDAARACVLPVRMTDWTDVMLTSSGGVVIDAMSYLCKNATMLNIPLFGNHCHALPGMIKEFLRTHLEISNPPTVLTSTKYNTVRMLHETIAWLDRRRSGLTYERLCTKMYNLNHCHFTFKNYLWDVHGCFSVQHGTTLTPFQRSSSLLMYGEPSSVRGDQNEVSLSKDDVHLLVRNIILRLRNKLFKKDRVETVSVNYTQGPVLVSVSPAALSDIPSLDNLDSNRAVFDENATLLTHDAVSLNSKWAPVIKITKHGRLGPVSSLNVTYYKAVVVFVLLRTDSCVLKLKDFFQHLQLRSFTGY